MFPRSSLVVNGIRFVNDDHLRSHIDGATAVAGANSGTQAADDPTWKTPDGTADSTASKVFRNTSSLHLNNMHRILFLT